SPSVWSPATWEGRHEATLASVRGAGARDSKLLRSSGRQLARTAGRARLRGGHAILRGARPASLGRPGRGRSGFDRGARRSGGAAHAARRAGTIWKRRTGYLAVPRRLGFAAVAGADDALAPATPRSRRYGRPGVVRHSAALSLAGAGGGV